ncbi:MAG: alpha/beta fold hydrolase, partial [Planctomycetota bacterium]
SPFIPPRFLANPHLQTIISYYYPSSTPGFPVDYRTIPLPDGDQLSIVVTKPQDWTADKRTIFLIHGLTGSHLSPYMIRMTGWFYDRGYQVIRINLRGAGSGVGLAKYPAHAGRSEDIHQVVQYVKENLVLGKSSIMGFSMGGNIALKLAGEWGRNHPSEVDSIFAVCPPINLFESIKSMDLPLNRLYERSFVQALVQQVEQLREYYPQMDLPNFPPNLRLMEFDEIYTAPYSGFSSVTEYYSTAQAEGYMPNISIPTLILASKDDPLVAWKPLQRFEDHPFIKIILTEKGGHLGFWKKSPPPFGYRWMDWVLVESVMALDHANEGPNKFEKE